MSRKNKTHEMVVIEAPSGSLIIPPNKIKTIFKSVFTAGLKCYEMHQDDDTYDEIHFNNALEKVYKSFPKDKRPF